LPERVLPERVLPERVLPERVLPERVLRVLSPPERGPPRCPLERSAPDRLAGERPEPP
jgi:hypothetical protein